MHYIIREDTDYKIVSEINIIIQVSNRRDIF